MKVILNKKQKQIRIHPAPQKDIPEGLVCHMNYAFQHKYNTSPFVATDVIKGQAVYTIDKEMRGQIKSVQIVDSV